jgi:hypothetical protein
MDQILTAKANTLPSCVLALGINFTAEHYTGRPSRLRRRRVHSSRRLLVRVRRVHKVGDDGKYEESKPVHYVRSFHGHPAVRGIV